MIQQFNRVFLLSLILVPIITVLAAEEPIPDLSEDPVVEIPDFYQNRKPQPQILPNKEDKKYGTTISASKSFHVVGDSVKLRSEVSSLAERILDDLREQLKQKRNTLPVPIFIRLLDGFKEQGSGSPYRKIFGNKPQGGYYVQLVVDLSRMKGAELRHEILEVITYSLAIEARETLADDAVLVSHDWLIDGLIEVFEWKAERSPVDEYLRLQKNPQLFDIERIFTMKTDTLRTLDPGTQRSYRAATGAFVMALLEQKDGEESMISLLNQLALFQGEAENALREHFPQLNRGTNGTRVAWLLQLATMSVPKLSDVMSILETEQKLTEALTFSVVVNEEVVELTIDDFETIATLEEQQRQILLDKVKRNLITIERRCFPFFREMLASYGRILVTLSKGETTEVATLVAGLKKERQLQKNAATQARDYMDWFEINQSNDVVGEYQRLLDTNKVKLEKDQLSEYVETLDNLFEN